MPERHNRRWRTEVLLHRRNAIANPSLLAAGLVQNRDVPCRGFFENELHAFVSDVVIERHSHVAA